MLNRRPSRQARPQHSQRGVVLMVALIVLIAMTLAGLALVRSMDTANLIAGNMAFREAATHSGDTGIETAVNWLEKNNGGGGLNADNLPMGYSSSRHDPAAGQTWDQFWSTLNVNPSSIVALPINAATGNTVSYTIHRLCNATGDPFSTGPNPPNCATAQASSSNTGGSKGAGAIQLQLNTAVYYRITARIVGPRNTVSFVQAIVAL